VEQTPNAVEAESSRTRLDVWRAERQETEQKWQRRLLEWLQAALAVFCPPMGLGWAWWYLLDEADLPRRLRGAWLVGWALLGIVVWLVLRQLGLVRWVSYWPH